jgi:K+-transporting ATPase ATPase C chain
MNIVSTIRPAVATLALFTILFGCVYPGVTSFSIQTLFPHQAQGSLIKDKDQNILGSELIGQSFGDPKHLWGRLSATGPVPYNAAASTGSNLGAANPVLLDAVKARIAALKAADPTNTQPVPVDLVTASGSGLDPEISIAAARYQIPRIAKARGISQETVERAIHHYTSGRQFGVLGEPRVNVLKVNLALDGKI